MAKRARTTETSKPGGRPRADKASARSEVLTYRVSVAERGRIAALAAQAGMRVSDYVRMRALGDAPEARPARTREADPALISELNRLTLELARVGNNANQLARATHRDSAFTQWWREIGAEVKVTTAAAHAALDKALDE